ncbi:hypothetical protein KIL84_002191 [Mauremys mutica]|uniref:Uncharacterized protein n=1 Tax=Mauremys mutica TaxID=74926 RepID=A0A9D4AYI2_9SAUR|nr:hypothetical protein KIL84_002191 [Mauremys mutica]
MVSVLPLGNGSMTQNTHHAQSPVPGPAILIWVWILRSALVLLLLASAPIITSILRKRPITLYDPEGSVWNGREEEEGEDLRKPPGDISQKQRQHMLWGQGAIVGLALTTSLALALLGCFLMRTGPAILLWVWILRSTLVLLLLASAPIITSILRKRPITQYDPEGSVWNGREEEEGEVTDGSGCPPCPGQVVGLAGITERSVGYAIVQKHVQETQGE